MTYPPLAFEFPNSNRAAIKNQFDGVLMGSPRGAQRQAVQAAQHEPTGVVARSACHASGDFCDARLTRAPQETGESLRSPSLGYLSWRSKKGDRPRAATERAGGTRNPHSEHNRHPLPSPLPSRERGPDAFMVRQAHHERGGNTYLSALNRTRCGLAASSPRR